MAVRAKPPYPLRDEEKIHNRRVRISSGYATGSAFVAFARQRSFSAAAAELRISQPAISKHIAELEHALGLELVERARRDGTLTSAGNFVANYAEDRASVVI